jgi:hypothetical protein
VLAGLGSLPPAAVAQGYDAVLNSGRRVMTAERLRAEEVIALDGILDEPVWQRAEPATGFIQQEPILGGKPTERTEVRMVFNRDHLYMGVICFDSEPDRLLGNTMKRDEFLGADDRFMWTMDTFLDQQSGYFFEMNPSGLMADSLMGAGGGSSREWDGIWNAKVRRSEIGWTIEIDIPFRTLNFDPNSPAWGINFQRTIRRKNEENLWTGHHFNQGLRRMSNAGLLVGIENVSQGFGLDVKPFVSGTVGDAPGGDPVLPLDGDGKVGVDLFYNVTPSLRANLTINTDFAETEVDQRQVNLTRFALFFPEKRDFFLDGAPFFDFFSGGGGGGGGFGGGGGIVQPFFSRRIGLKDGIEVVNEDGEVEEIGEGEPQKIDFGAKLTGQAGAHDIGVLFVRTAPETVFAGEDFAVVRMRRRMLRQSYIGGIYTLRHPRATVDPTRQTAGLDLHLATSEFRGSQNLALDGFFLWNTDVTGAGDNLAYGARLDYPNDRWNGGLSYYEVQENHNPAVGFTRRNGFRRYRPELRFSPRPEGQPWIRRLSFGASANLFTDQQNRFVTREGDLTLLRVELHSQDEFEFSIQPTYERLDDDFEISDGVVLPEAAEYDFTRSRIFINTADRRLISTFTRLEWGSFFSGRRREFNTGLGIRPRPGVTIGLDFEWNQIDLPEGAFETRLYRIVADTQFNPWAYLVNNIQYDSVSRMLGWQSRFRWIITPGSDLYFVYTHNWLDDPSFGRFQTQDRRAATKVVYTHRF